MTVTETLSAAVFGTALVAMRMLRGLMWVLAIAVVACLATTAIDDAGRVVPLGATSARRTDPVVRMDELRLHLQRPASSAMGREHLGV